MVLTFEILYYETEEYHISVFAFPAENIARIYYNGHHFDTIPLKREFLKIKYIEHHTLGRCEL